MSNLSPADKKRYSQLYLKLMQLKGLNRELDDKAKKWLKDHPPVKATLFDLDRLERFLEGHSPSGSTPSPSGSTPSPSGSTPSPSGNAPSPSGSTPSPSGNAPSFLEKRNAILSNNPSDFVKGFIDSITQRVKRGRGLTPKQTALLDKFYGEATGAKPTLTQESKELIDRIEAAKKKGGRVKPFLDSLKKQIESGRTLSQKQLDALGRIEGKGEAHETTTRFLSLSDNAKRMSLLDRRCIQAIGLSGYLRGEAEMISSKGRTDMVSRETLASLVEELLRTADKHPILSKMSKRQLIREIGRLF
jgi:hypothetical protein